MIGKTFFIAGLSLLLAGTIHGEVQACPWCSEQGFNMDCNNQRLGVYGARKSIKSIEEARRELMEYYAGSNIRIGKLIEKSSHFEAEVLDHNKKLLDKVIIHKRSGRIRSIQ